MDIFNVVDMVDMSLTNTTNKYYMINDRLVAPNSGPSTLYQLGINFCRFKEQYISDPLLKQWFDDGLLISTPVIDAGSGGIVCPFESVGGISGTLPPGSPTPGMSWVRLPDATLFIWDDGRGKWLNPSENKYEAGRGFTLAANLALFGVDGTPTSQTPIRIAKNETLVGLTLESESTTGWTAQIRDFITKVPIPGATASLSGTKSISVTNLNIDFTAGQEVEIYLSAASGISFPRVTFYSKERG